MEIPEVLTRQAGPLPVWGWAALGGGGLLLLAHASTRGTATGATTLPTAGSTIGQTQADVQGQVAEAVAAQLASDRTAFGDMLKAAQDADAAALAAQQAQFSGQLSSEQATFAQQLAAAAKATADALTQQRAGDQSIIDQLKAALAAALAAGQNAAPSLGQSTDPTKGGSVGAPNAPGVIHPQDPITTQPPPASVPAFQPPAWLAQFIPWGQIKAGYNADHTLPFSLDKIYQDAKGFVFPGGQVLPGWAFTPVNVRGQTINLPIMFTGKGANADDTINLIVGRLNAIADGAYGWGVTSGSASDPRNVYIVVRSVIEDQIHRGKPADSLGLGGDVVSWFLAGSV